MRIRITRKEDALCFFESDCGTGVGLFQSPDFTPPHTADVELECTGVLKWGRELTASESTRMSIHHESGMVTIKGKLVSLEADNVLTLQLGNSILLLETDGRPDTLPPFVSVHIQPESLLFYPVSH